MATPVELEQEIEDINMRSLTRHKERLDAATVSAATPAPRRLSATFIGAVLGASLMASPAAAQEVQRECKVDRWTVEQYPVQVCPPQSSDRPRGGAYVPY